MWLFKVVLGLIDLYGRKRLEDFCIEVKRKAWTKVKTKKWKKKKKSKRKEKKSLLAASVVVENILPFLLFLVS